MPPAPDPTSSKPPHRSKPHTRSPICSSTLFPSRMSPITLPLPPNAPPPRQALLLLEVSQVHSSSWPNRVDGLGFRRSVDDPEVRPLISGRPQRQWTARHSGVLACVHEGLTITSVVFMTTIARNRPPPPPSSIRTRMGLPHSSDFEELLARMATRSPSLDSRTALPSNVHTCGKFWHTWRWVRSPESAAF